MTACRLDHLVVVAPELEAGSDFVGEALGVALQAGGSHPRMGTHNRVLRLGQGRYLEVIAPDPGARPPARPRWFGLDALRPGSAPVLATWVVRTDRIEQALAVCPVPLGDVEAMSRGDLRWRITIPRDGGLVWDGLVPALIQWETQPHPAAGLRDLGCSLERFELLHPDPVGLHAVLDRMGAGGEVEVHAQARGLSPALRAHIRTPGGVSILDSGFAGKGPGRT